MKKVQASLLLATVLFVPGCGRTPQDMCKNAVGVEACEQKKRCAQEIKSLRQKFRHDCSKAVDLTSKRVAAVYKTKTEKKKKAWLHGKRTQLELLASAFRGNDRNVQRVVEFFTDILEKDFDHPVVRERKILKFLKAMIARDLKK